MSYMNNYNYLSKIKAIHNQKPSNKIIQLYFLCHLSFVVFHSMTWVVVARKEAAIAQAQVEGAAAIGEETTMEEEDL